MLKTRVLAALFFFTGLLLAGSSPSPTGAVIGLAPGNSISFLVVSEWRLVPDSNLAELLSRLIFRYFTYIFTFFFWCFFIYYLPMYFTWLLIFILPFYLINLFHSYITLTSFLIKIFWLRFSGNVFYDFTFDLRREMIEHPKNPFDC